MIPIWNSHESAQCNNSKFCKPHFISCTVIKDLCSDLLVVDLFNILHMVLDMYIAILG